MSRRHVRLHRWSIDSDSTWAAGPARDYEDPFGDEKTIAYEQRTWTAPAVASAFDVVSAIASWTATTPAGTWIEVAVRRDDTSDWLVLARWAETDDEIHRTTVTDQEHDGASVSTDEIVIDRARAWRSAQLRVSSMRRPGPGPWPTVTSVALSLSGARTSTIASAASGRAHALDVPPYSQQLHRDELAVYGGGGQSWCSPTSVSMVLEFWGASPDAEPVVPYAATQTYDHAFGGTGNWAFNTAYAARYGLSAFVTRLRSLAEAEEFTLAGIPLVLSVVFTQDQLEGAGYDTEGHLVVLVGFDEEGNAVVNDPASHRIASLDEVRTTYRRDQFEQAWLGRSSGVAYVMHPPDVALPPAPPEANW